MYISTQHMYKSDQHKAKRAANVHPAVPDHCRMYVRTHVQYVQYGTLNIRQNTPSSNQSTTSAQFVIPIMNITIPSLTL